MGAGIRSLNIWLALTPCGVDAPSLDVVARRFDHLLATKGTSQSYGVNPDAALDAANGAVVRPVFEPGDALLFDHMCLHRTGGDSSMRHGRYAIETWFFAPSTYGAMTRGGDGEHNFQDQLPLVF